MSSASLAAPAGEHPVAAPGEQPEQHDRAEDGGDDHEHAGDHLEHADGVVEGVARRPGAALVVRRAGARHDLDADVRVLRTVRAAAQARARVGDLARHDPQPRPDALGLVDGDRVLELAQQARPLGARVVEPRARRHDRGGDVARVALQPADVAEPRDARDRVVQAGRGHAQVEDAAAAAGDARGGDEAAERGRDAPDAVGHPVDLAAGGRDGQRGRPLDLAAGAVVRARVAAGLRRDRHVRRGEAAGQESSPAPADSPRPTSALLPAPPAPLSSSLPGSTLTAIRTMIAIVASRPKAGASGRIQAQRGPPPAALGEALLDAAVELGAPRHRRLRPVVAQQQRDLGDLGELGVDRPAREHGVDGLELGRLRTRHREPPGASSGHGAGACRCWMR